VISFALEESKSVVHGQIVVSVDTAARAADQFGWTREDELLLYAIHGALHLAGYEDSTAASRREMRRREQLYLAKFGLKPRYQGAEGRQS
jgi:probable rRNA maturation factor